MKKQKYSLNNLSEVLSSDDETEKAKPKIEEDWRKYLQSSDDEDGSQKKNLHKNQQKSKD